MDSTSALSPGKFPTFDFRSGSKAVFPPGWLIDAGGKHIPDASHYFLSAKIAARCEMYIFFV